MKIYVFLFDYGVTPKKIETLSLSIDKKIEISQWWQLVKQQKKS
jgi:hypothetical protein